MTVTYSLAPEVAKIGRQLLKQHHDSDLLDQRIEYLFRSEAAKAGGRTIWGKARKITGLNAFLADKEPAEGPISDDTPDVEAFFVIEIAYDVWLTLTSKQKVALVDHELNHLQVGYNESGELVLKLRAHDLEEFEDVVRRHGLWKKDVEHFVKVAADQLNLLDQDDDEGDPSIEELDAERAENMTVTVTHIGADGTTESVETTTGEITQLADRLRRRKA